MQLRRGQWLLDFVRWGSVLSLLAIMQQTVFSVRQIDCTQSTGTTCSNETNATLQQIIGQPLLFNDLEQKINQLKFAHPTRGQVTAKRLPQTLIVTLTQQPALYQIKGSDYSVTRSGFLFQSTDQTSLTVSLAPGIFDGHNLNSKVHQRLSHLITNLAQADIQPKTIDWQSDENIILNLKNGLVVIVDTNIIATAGQKLNLILQAPAIKNFNLAKMELDLRLKLPVLRKRT